MLTRLLQQLSSSNSLTLWFAFTCGSKDLLDQIIIQHIFQIVVLMVSRNPPVCENWETPDNISFKQDGGLSILAEILFQLTQMEQRMFRLQMKERFSRWILTKSTASVDFWRKKPFMRKCGIRICNSTWIFGNSSALFTRVYPANNTSSSSPLRMIFQTADPLEQSASVGHFPMKCAYLVNLIHGCIRNET